ncbi:MAG: hypothetical protein LIP23_08090 [Planctomycetes bacterium]|nr:hypothetical protein [Planctomycetota bacterium]
MLKINLLPRELRKKDGFTPVQLLILTALVALVGVLAFSIREFSVVVIPGLETRRADLAAQRERLLGEVAAARQNAVQARYESAMVAALRQAYADGADWSKALGRLKSAVAAVQPDPADPSAASALWLGRIAGVGKNAHITGYAMAAASDAAPQLSASLADALRQGGTHSTGVAAGMWTGAPEPLRRVGTEQQRNGLWNFQLNATFE